MPSSEFWFWFTRSLAFLFLLGGGNLTCLSACHAPVHTNECISHWHTWILHMDTARVCAVCALNDLPEKQVLRIVIVGIIHVFLLHSSDFVFCPRSQTLPFFLSPGCIISCVCVCVCVCVHHCCVGTSQRNIHQDILVCPWEIDTEPTNGEPEARSIQAAVGLCVFVPNGRQSKCP